MKRYIHKEAFCLMLYRDTAGNEEWIWNSRDGVTPFSVMSRQGLEAYHVDWWRDQRVPHHVPKLGDRVFIDLTIERARELRQAYVDHWWDYESMIGRYSSKEDMVEQLAKGDLENVGAPDIAEVALVPYRSIP